MDLYTIVSALVASILYMFLFWLPKRIDADKPQNIDLKKVLRTLVWGVLVGVAVIVFDVEVSFSSVEQVFVVLSGMRDRKSVV